MRRRNAAVGRPRRSTRPCRMKAQRLEVRGVWEGDAEGEPVGPAAQPRQAGWASGSQTLARTQPATPARGTCPGTLHPPPCSNRAESFRCDRRLLRPLCRPEPGRCESPSFRRELVGPAKGCRSHRPEKPAREGGRAPRSGSQRNGDQAFRPVFLARACPERRSASSKHRSSTREFKTGIPSRCDLEFPTGLVNEPGDKCFRKRLAGKRSCLSETEPFAREMR